MADERLNFATDQQTTELEMLGASDKVIGYCPTCGSPVMKRSGKGRQKVFCTKKCCDRYSYLQRDKRNWSGKQTKICEHCGEEFTAYRENSYTQRYCSLSCARRAAVERQRKEDANDLGNKERVEGPD